MKGVVEPLLRKDLYVCACNKVIDLLSGLGLSEIEKFYVMQTLWDNFPNKEQFMTIEKEVKK